MEVTIEFSFWTGLMQGFGFWFGFFFNYHCTKRLSILLKVSDDTFS